MIEVIVHRFLPQSPNRTRGEHWSKAQKRRDEARLRTLAALGTRGRPELPVTVTMTRVSRGRIPDMDNAVASLKAVRDTIAFWLGVDDGDEGSVVFVTERARGWPPQVRIRIEKRR